MKPLVIGLSVALLCVSGVLFYETTQRVPVVGVSAAQATPRPIAPTKGAPVASVAPAVDIRAQIRQADEVNQATLKTEQDVDRYLETLIARAKQNRRVTALEVQPGIHAILELTEQIGDDRAMAKHSQFTKLMARLSAEFSGEAPLVE